MKPIAINTHIDYANNSECSVRDILRATKQGAFESVLVHFLLLQSLLWPPQDTAELMNQQCNYSGVCVGSGLEQRISHRLSLQSCLLWHEIIGVSGPGNFFYNIQLSWLCVLHKVVHLGSIIHWTFGHVIGIEEINEL